MKAFILGIILLAVMATAAGIAVEIVLHETVSQIEVLPPVHVKVKKLMAYHGVTYFDWHEQRQEYGFWRGGRWCPAR